MKRPTVIEMMTAMFLLLVIALFSGRASVSAQSLPELVQRVKPSVAWVRAEPVCGTAFVVDAQGLLVTAAHVVEAAKQSPTVQFPGGGDVMPAEVVAVSIEDDLAILRIGRQDLAPLPLADMSTVKAGADAILVGYPRCTGPDPSVARGIVGGLNRSILNGRDVFQLDVAMSRGESGGPVMNPSGEVIGVVDAVRPDVTPQGVAVGQSLNYAVPSDAVKLILTRALDPAKSHPALSFPLRATVTQTVRVKDNAGSALKQAADAACADPPEGALSIAAVHGTLKSAAALDIVMWLAPKDYPEVRIALLGPKEGSKDVDFVREYQTELRPVPLCVSFAAQSQLNFWNAGIWSLIPLGFEVTYAVDYKVWSSEITGRPLPTPTQTGPAPVPQPEPKQAPPEHAVVTWTTQPNGPEVRVALRVVVPTANVQGARQAVKVVAISSGGLTKTVYEGTHGAGETVSVSTSDVAPFIIQVYVEGSMVKQITVPSGS